MKVKHIPHLSDAETALRLLTRIHNEFYPIIERRGYSVLSLSEMCCCGDGLDYDESKKRKRKLRKVGLNILGYNVTHPNRTHTIHLRLRDVRNHDRLLSYEEVAGTMAHELAHCVHGPHDARFYKLMDEIQEQHAVFMVRGIVADKSGFPMNSNQAHTLGGSGRGSGSALEAAQRRQQKTRWMPQGPQKLGGDSNFRSWLAPGEAAGMAAEARRLRDEMWCQPCQDTIELSDSEEEGETPGAARQNDAYDRKHAAVFPQTGNEDVTDDRKPAAVVTETEGESDAVARPASVVTIDLTLSDDEFDEAQSNSQSAKNVAAVSCRTRKRSKEQRGNRTHAEETAAIVLQDGRWPCPKCTFVNAPLALACGMCLAEANPTDSTMKVVADIRRKDEIEQVKKTEVERSKEQFGFNIYGSARQVTAKLKHIT
jgi:hypothetical protein